MFVADRVFPAAVGDSAVLPAGDALALFGTVGLAGKAHRVGGTGDLFDPLNRRVKRRDDLILSDDIDDLSGAVEGRGGAVSVSVHVIDHALFEKSVRRAEIDV